MYECYVQNCKDLYGGWAKINAHDGKNFYRLLFCKKHFKKVHSMIKEREKKECKKNKILAFVPMEWIEEALQALQEHEGKNEELSSKGRQNNNN